MLQDMGRYEADAEPASDMSVARMLLSGYFKNISKRGPNGRCVSLHLLGMQCQ